MNNYPLYSERFNEIIKNISLRKTNYSIEILKFVNENYKNKYLIDHEKAQQLDIIKMIDIRHENGDVVLSFLPKGKEVQINENGKWSRKNRQVGKLGKTLRGFIEVVCKGFNIRLPNAAEIEELVNEVKSTFSNANYEFNFLSGEDIRKYYHYDNYQSSPSDSGSTLFASCMRYTSCQKYFDIYVHNPNCKMLVMFDKSLSSNKIVGRALVWTVGGQMYVDRRYYSSDVYNYGFMEFIRINKLNYKTHNTYDNEYARMFEVFNEEIEDYETKTDIELTFQYNHNFSNFPYCDTVKYFNPTTKILSNVVDEGYCLCTTEGSYIVIDQNGNEINDDDDEMYYCEVCNCRDHYENMTYLERGDVYVCNNHAVSTYEDEFVREDCALRVIVNHSDFAWVHEDDIEEAAIRYNNYYYILPNPHTDSIIEELENIDPEKLLTDYIKINEVYALRIQ